MRLFAGHTEEKLPRYYESALERLVALPGIVSASYSRKPPVSSSEGSWWDPVGVDDRPADARGERTYLNAVSEAYFTTTGVRVLAGRTFDRRDGPGAPPVVVVNARLTERLFGTESPLGRRLNIERRPSTRVLRDRRGRGQRGLSVRRMKTSAPSRISHIGRPPGCSRTATSSSN